MPVFVLFWHPSTQADDKVTVKKIQPNLSASLELKNKVPPVSKKDLKDSPMNPLGQKSKERSLVSGGTSDNGGSGGQFKDFITSKYPADLGQINPDLISKGFPEEYCQDFYNNAVAGIELLKILWFAAELKQRSAGNKGQSSDPQIFPLMKLELVSSPKESSFLHFKDSETSMKLSRVYFSNLKIESHCASHRAMVVIQGNSFRRIDFQVNPNIKAADGKVLIASNNKEKSLIELNSDNWELGKIFSEFECHKYFEPLKCAANAKRMIAVHEILSLILEQKIEKTRSYPLSAPMFIHFNKSCQSLEDDGKLLTSMKQAVGLNNKVESYTNVERNQSATDPHYFEYLKDLYPQLYKKASNSLRIAYQELERWKKIENNLDFLSQVLDCLPYNEEEYMALQKALTYWSERANYLTRAENLPYMPSPEME